MAKEEDYHKWNRLDWWEWNIEQLEKMLSGQLTNPASIEKAKSFKIVFDFVEKTGLKIGTKVRYFTPWGTTIVGFIEEPLLLAGEFVSNIEQNRFSGQNSFLNYLIKYAPLKEMQIIQN